MPMSASSEVAMHSGESDNPRKRRADAMSVEAGVACDGGGGGGIEDAVLIKDFIPRSYQLKVYEVARKRNTIAVLETGAGKTMIAVMLIKDVYRAMKQSGFRQVIVFLAPTVHLVNQQFEVIKSHTELKVGDYYGAKGVDDWSMECWEKEISEHDVLVMTPQILLDALRKAFITMNMIYMIILDECHRTAGNHPYAKIMKEFYHNLKDRPKIFGMTASPVIRKGVSSIADCEGQLSQLESTLDSQIYTIQDRTELEQFVPAAQEEICWYQPSPISALNLIDQMESCWSKCDDFLVKVQSSLESNYKDVDDRFQTLRKRLSTDHAKILHCLNDLGLICAHEAAKVCLENASHSLVECDMYGKSLMQWKYYLQEVLKLLESSMSADPLIGYNTLSESQQANIEAIRVGLVSPKLHQLIQLFGSFGDAADVLCLIFVDRIITAKVIERLTKRITRLSHFTVSYLTGSNSSVDALAPHMQRETLQSFRSGMVNLLFATDVVEEGIHVPNCSYVIRFDLPKTVRSYVQSRGRARQNKSRFIMMLERGNKKQKTHVFDIHRSEVSMTDKSAKRDPNMSAVLKSHVSVDEDVYVVQSTGALVSADSSMSLLHRYCDKLPGDKSLPLKPTFQLEMTEGMYQCKLTLPPNAILQTVVGPLARSSHLSKQLVCLEACKELHQMGGLDDHLLPSTEDTSQNISTVNQKGSSAASAGTTKRKELHGTACVHALSGGWVDNVDGANVYAYRMDFSCSIVDEQYSGFVLLIEAKLDDDVGSFQMDLFMHSNKQVKALVTPCGQVRMDFEQVTKAKRFQEFFFNGTFGRLFTGTKSSRDLIFKSAGESLWKSSKMYLLLPLNSTNNSCHDSWEINWAGVDSTINVVQFLKNAFNASLESKVANIIKEKTSIETDYDSTNVVHFANGLVKIENLREMVVLAAHTGRIYSIIEILPDMTAESPFDGNNPDTISISFANYFEKRYGIVLSHPGQPLLLLKQSHNAHNLLTDFNEEGTRDKKPQKPQMHIRMPPELLATIDVPRTVIKSIYLLPSIMHRVESLMLASQLRRKIGGHLYNIHISSSLILEALTTLRCGESFSMERLELLGDSVLKYSVSCNIFLRYPKKHEGQLTAQRQLAICNSTLHKLGIDKKLQGYVRDSPFDPRRWLAPGQRSVREVPCLCGVDTLEVPLESKFLTEDPKIKIGLACDMGHRWMVSKTIADCVEALIGAYYDGGGLTAALHVMKWFGVDADIDQSLVIEMIKSASIHSYIPQPVDIKILESKLGYEFSVKSLLQEAVTRASEQEVGVSYCYQRLEFLGDALLDLLITRHLYQSHKDIDQGELTDLRSASVNNENFAQVAVRHQLHPHFQNCSGLLLTQIEEYVTFLSISGNNRNGHHDKKGPKDLGDLVESIAGSILIDTKLDIDEVWRIYKLLLSPIVTPDKLQLLPHRELTELCDSLGYFINENWTRKGDVVHAELRLQLKDVLLVRQGTGNDRKTARGQAASYLLEDLEKQGISYSRSSLKKGNETQTSLAPVDKNDRPKTTELLLAAETDGGADELASCIPVIGSIDMKKGGPRSSLFQLCRRLQWPMPSFETTEAKSRTPLSFGEGPDKRQGFNSYASEITLHIPNRGDIVVMGEERADKKSSYDSAALLMLYKLEQLGLLVIDGSSVPNAGSHNPVC
uniref:Uncharacterized protein n=1 Tax=Kalanchoe fedtschenkoi TaxID=63787 RepID=A0A7N0U744_KALFE